MCNMFTSVMHVQIVGLIYTFKQYFLCCVFSSQVPLPEIKLHPRTEAVNLTETVTFTCFATGYDVSYWWTSGSGSFPTRAWGVYTNNLVITGVRSSDHNTYTCVASNEGGNVSSNNATLKITGMIFC